MKKHENLGLFLKKCLFFLNFSANDDMLKNLQDNIKNLKLGLQTNYDLMNKTMNEGYEKATLDFKTKTEALIKQSEECKTCPTLNKDELKNCLTFLANHHKQVVEANGKRYKGILDNLDKVWC